MTRFDLMSRFYDRMSPYADGGRMRANLAPEPGMTVLDVGGGTGQVHDAVVTSDVRWIVVDPSEGMLARARGRGLAVVRADAARLPFRSGAVDRYVMVDALHHVPRQDEAIREAHRALAADGRAVVEEFRTDRRLTRWGVKLMEGLCLFGSRFDREAGWRRRFEAAGFHVAVDVLSWLSVQFVLTRSSEPLRRRHATDARSG